MSAAAVPAGSPRLRHLSRHLPALDGLRGLALLGVLFFHANGALVGGYLGVDLFFVLSGFLITRLLLAEHEATGRIALAAFWTRRARRLFPALLSLIPVIALYARFVAAPEELARLRGDALATLAYVANWRVILAHGSYWDLFSAPSPLEHMWSLAIEEQFYVGWPLLVAVVLRRGSRRSVFVVAAGLAVASMAAMLALFDPANVTRAYLGTDTRAAGILFGAGLACLLSPGASFSNRAVRALDGLGLVAFVGLAWAWSSLDGERPFLYRGGFWLTEVAALVLIVVATLGERSLLARALAVQPLRWVGTISYGVYLWHWPVDVFLSENRVHLHGPPLHVLHFAVTFLIAITSYRLLEQPIRVRGLPFGRPVYMVPAAVGVAVLLVVRGTHARLVPASPTALAPPPVVSEEVGPPFRVLVVGDSTANSLGWVLRGLREPGVTVELAGRDGCTMLADTCGGAEWGALTASFHPDATLVLFGGAFLHGITADGGWHKACYPAWDQRFRDNVALRLGALRAPPGEVWVATIPYPLGPYETDAFRKETDCINASLKSAATSIPGVHVLDLARAICPEGVCSREAHGQPVRVDGVHYTMEGGADAARWLLGELRLPTPDQASLSPRTAPVSSPSPQPD